MTTGKLRVGLLYGGVSVEHEVSVVSARGVLKALDPGRFECLPLAIRGDGRWLSPGASLHVLRSSADRVEDADPEDGARVVADPGSGLVLSRPGERHERIAVDVVFTVAHGWGGEDGRIQGFLDVAGVPYVGAGVLGSALAMDKRAAKEILTTRGVPVVPWRAVDRARWKRHPGELVEELDREIGYPLFVKPANGGSSVGISKVAERDDLARALDIAFEHDRGAVVERGIDAREIEVAVLGNAEPRASVPGEIVPSREFYDYAAKYLDGTSELLIPAPIDPEVADRARDLALEAFRALDLAGMARVDFFLDRRAGDLFLNEVNTLPGFTPISMYPKLWDASGVSYGDLLGTLIDLALERSRDERERETRRSDHGR